VNISSAPSGDFQGYLKKRHEKYSIQGDIFRFMKYKTNSKEFGMKVIYMLLKPK